MVSPVKEQEDGKGSQLKEGLKISDDLKNLGNHLLKEGGIPEDKVQELKLALAKVEHYTSLQKEEDAIMEKKLNEALKDLHEVKATIKRKKEESGQVDKVIQKVAEEEYNDQTAPKNRRKRQVTSLLGQSQIQTAQPIIAQPVIAGQLLAEAVTATNVTTLGSNNSTLPGQATSILGNSNTTMTNATSGVANANLTSTTSQPLTNLTNNALIQGANHSSNATVATNFPSKNNTASIALLPMPVSNSTDKGSLVMSVTKKEKELETAPKGLLLKVINPGNSTLKIGQTVDGNLNPMNVSTNASNTTGAIGSTLGSNTNTTSFMSSPAVSNLTLSNNSTKVENSTDRPVTGSIGLLGLGGSNATNTTEAPGSISLSPVTNSSKPNLLLGTTGQTASTNTTAGSNQTALNNLGKVMDSSPASSRVIMGSGQPVANAPGMPGSARVVMQPQGAAPPPTNVNPSMLQSNPAAPMPSRPVALRPGSPAQHPGASPELSSLFHETGDRGGLFPWDSNPKAKERESVAII